MELSPWRACVRAIACTCVVAGLMWAAWPAKAEMWCKPLVDEIAAYENAGVPVSPVPGGIEAVKAYASLMPFALPDVAFTGMAVADAGGLVVVAILIEGDCTTYSIRVSRDLHIAAMQAVRGV